MREKENSSHGNLSTQQKAGDVLRAWITRCHEGITNSLKNNARPRRMRRRQKRGGMSPVSSSAHGPDWCVGSLRPYGPRRRHPLGDEDALRIRAGLV